MKEEGRRWEAEEEAGEETGRRRRRRLRELEVKRWRRVRTKRDQGRP